MSHAASLQAIMADHDLRVAAKARDSRVEHARLVALGKVCNRFMCYNKPGNYSLQCFNHKHGHIAE